MNSDRDAEKTAERRVRPDRGIVCVSMIRASYGAAAAMLDAQPPIASAQMHHEPPRYGRQQPLLKSLPFRTETTDRPRTPVAGHPLPPHPRVAALRATHGAPTAANEPSLVSRAPLVSPPPPGERRGVLLPHDFFGAAHPPPRRCRVAPRAARPGGPPPPPRTKVGPPRPPPPPPPPGGQARGPSPP